MDRAKYTDEAEALVHQLDADGIGLLVFGGARGDGFAVAITSIRLVALMPTVLRDMADAIERENREKGIVAAVVDRLPGPKK